jgi:hypothetical protein
LFLFDGWRIVERERLSGLFTLQVMDRKTFEPYLGDTQTLERHECFA